jgi:basic amino acid/polyamine antiporter, APA family
VIFSAPLFWAFFTMVAVSLFLLRYRSGTPDGYRVPFYPLLPVLFCLFSASMFGISLDYAWGRMAPELIWVFRSSSMRMLATSSTIEK